jgi:hypothetical protein
MLTETELQALIDAIEITDKNGVRWHLETSSITRSLYSDDQPARLIDFQILRAGEEMSGRVRLGSDRSARELRDLLSGVARAIVNGELPPEAIEFI